MPALAKLVVNDTVAVLTLERPEARNALSIELLHDLHARLDELDSREQEPTVLVLTGAGRCFCAGMDLRQVTAGPEAARALLSSLARFTIRLRSLACVTVAAINGAAIGGGCGLATVCDIAITHADSKMGFPEVDLGVCPAVVAPWLVRKIGAGRARAVLLRGGTMTGAQAHRLGIVDEVTAGRDLLDQAVDRMAGRLAEGGPAAIRATKGLLNEIDGSLDAQLIERGASLSASVISDPQTLESLRQRFGAA